MIVALLTDTDLDYDECTGSTIHLLTTALAEEYSAPMFIHVISC